MGSHYTWTNNQSEGARIYSKFDRIFKNEDWVDLFPDSVAVVNWDICSDHCFCIVKTMTEMNSGTKPFRYFNMWADHDEFKATVLQSWTKPVTAQGLDRIMVKLRRLRPILRHFNKFVIGDIDHKFQVAKDTYNMAQIQLQQDIHSAMFQVEEQQALSNLVQTSRLYDSYLRQRSKVNWLRLGDDNTTFFHAYLKKRKEVNRITSFLTETGQIIDNYEEVVDHFLSHFRSLLGSRSKASGTIHRECFRHGNILSLEQQLDLIRPFTKKDVKSAMFSIGSIKSPGPDGYGAGFFKALWNEIGDEISYAILSFFQLGKLPQGFNDAMLSLIPKVEHPTKAVEYGPIACCNTLYKCISKLICNRLNVVLPWLIHQNQGAFVKDRILAHNILIFQDILKGYKRKNISPRCMMKVDLSKAYDSIDWHCLEDILAAFCIPAQFINWINICLKDSDYSILMNGRVQGCFTGRKGLKQGDPMSPLLFVLVMEYFTRLLIQASQNKEFRFHPRCKKLELVSLCFADDLVLFCKGTNRSVQIITECFKSFSSVSGLTANVEKSRVYFGGMNAAETKEILKDIRFSEGEFPLKYLGVPLRPTKWKAGDCAAIIKKIQLKLHHWSNRHLSFAGKTQLIQSVLMGLRAFWMSIFLLPKSVISEIDHLCRKFLWGASKGNDNRSKIHFTSWDQVCLPKQLGGLGFKEGAKWNMVLLAKYLWVVSSKQDILWVKWVDAIYLKGQSVWDYKLQSDVSWYWRKLINLKAILNSELLGRAVQNNKLKVSNLYNLLLHKDKVHKRVTNISSFSVSFLSCCGAKLLLGLGCEIWPVHLNDWVTWMVGKPKCLQQKLLAAGLAASVYLIWWNRNNCFFNLCSVSVNAVFALLQNCLKARLENLHRFKLHRKDVAFLEKTSIKVTRELDEKRHQHFGAFIESIKYYCSFKPSVEQMMEAPASNVPELGNGPPLPRIPEENTPQTEKPPHHLGKQPMNEENPHEGSASAASQEPGQGSKPPNKDYYNPKMYVPMVELENRRLRESLDEATRLNEEMMRRVAELQASPQ
ncbi:uncharacterized protein LOC133799682 [Humulus lupulus]|uniref:uncharacterized protein LOC133799682 n=1 Tax=Humulus lupulus TaxID=3486 RepID=UPI002B404D65|nr:uncharacterized protein LOC133799682 [Humulus lupulus]